MSDSPKLSVDLEARVTAFEKQLKKAFATADKNFGDIEKRGLAMTRKLDQQFASFGKGALSGIFAGISLNGAKDLIDTATRIQNSLKVTGLQGDKLKAVYDNLFASAQKNAAPLETLVTLYSRASQVQKELGVSTADLLKFTDNVALALRVQGADANTASGALLQLGQALGSGVVHAEEFNSILEGAPTIAKAAAAGLEEAGGSVAKLRTMVINGQVSSEAFFAAFQAGATTLQAQAAGSVLTVAQAFNKLQNSLVDAAGRMNDVSGASRDAVGLLDRLAGVVTGLSNVFAAAADGPIGSFIGKLSALNDLIKSVLPGFRALGLLDEGVLNKVADAIGPSAGPASVPVAGGKGGRVVADPIQNRIDAAFGTDKPKTVSLKDFATAKSTKTGGGSKKSKESDLAREIAQIKERTAALQAETAAQAGLNPLVDDFGFAVDKARTVQGLLNAAQKAGVAITPELKAQIDALATGYAQAGADAAKLQDSQDKIRQAADDFNALGKDVLGGFISDLRAGKTGAEALAGALDKVANKLLDVGLNSLFDSKSGGGFGSLLSGIGSFFGLKDGGAVHLAGGGRVSGPGGPRGDKIPAMLSDGEHVTNSAMAKKYASLLNAINNDRVASLAGGGFVTSIPIMTPNVPRLQAPANQNRPSVVEIHVVGEPGPQFIPTIQAHSRDVAVRVTQAGIGKYDQQLNHTIGGKIANAQARKF